MTDAHTHVLTAATRHFLCEPLDIACAPGADDRLFFGVHPWAFADPATAPDALARAQALDARLAAAPSVGVGEIGLDRLKVRAIPDVMREAFVVQLEAAARRARPVVLHGAKCWGEVVRACRPFAGRIPAFLFHGFSRSGGLLPDIVALNGFVSVGPSVLNDHAVNYRELVCALPEDRILVETDRTDASIASPTVEEIAARVAALRGVTLEALSARLEANAAAFESGACLSDHPLRADPGACSVGVRNARP